jgi:hypothetical protein
MRYPDQVQESRGAWSTLLPYTFGRGDIDGNYSRFKLGCRRDINQFATWMQHDIAVSLGQRLVSESWFITGPPLTSLPSAANLLALEVAERLRGKGADVIARNMTKRSDTARFPQGHYASLTEQERAEELTQSMTDKWIHDPSFRGGNVIFLDDVKITGSHEMIVRQYFSAQSVKAVHWHYLLEVQINEEFHAHTEEPRLNNLFIDRPGELLDIFRRNDLTPTTKMVWGLFSMSIEAFNEICQVITKATATKILRALISEGINVNGELANRVVALRLAAEFNDQPGLNSKVTSALSAGPVDPTLQ